MTYQEARQIAVAKLQNATVDTLKEAAVAINNNLKLDNNVLSLILDVIETRMSEYDFATFCESLG